MARLERVIAMNRQIPRIGAAIVCVTVFLFAVCLIVDFSFGSYLVCMLLPLGYIMTAAGFQHEADDDRKVAANVGLVLSAVYATLILLVYFAQNTSVRLDGLGDAALRVLDFKRGGLIFNYDLLGYGMMALSTFFIGLSVRVEALYNQNGQMGVWVYDVPGGTFVPVEVLSTDGSIAMIQPLVDGALQLGQTVLIK